MKVGSWWTHMNLGLLYCSLFYGSHRTNGKQIYGIKLCRDNPYDYLLFCWGNYRKQLYGFREHKR